MTEAPSTLFRGGTIVTMDPQRRVLCGDVLVSAGKIAAIGESGAIQVESADEVDVRGKVMVPGLIQGHVHLGQALFRGLAEGRELMDWLRERVWPLEAAHDHASAYWSGMLGAADCVRSGTTTIQDIGIVTHMDGVFEAIRDSGMRAIAGKCLMDSGLGVPQIMLEDPKAAAQEAKALHQTWHGAANGRIEGSVCPRFILSCSTKLWEHSVALARELDIPMHTHLLEHEREEQEVHEVLGVSQFEYLDRLGVLDTDLRIAHGVQFGPQHCERLDGRALRIIHCPSSNLKLGSGIADLGLFARTPGVHVGIGTDGAPCNNDMDVLEEIRLAALLQGIRQRPGAFSALAAFEMATIGGAHALGLEDRVGSLEVGKAADLVVLDLERPASFGPVGVSVYDRIVYGAGRDAVCDVMVDGRFVLRSGELSFVDERELMAKAGEQIAALVTRAGILEVASA